jgi:hypothetical protein
VIHSIIQEALDRKAASNSLSTVLDQVFLRLSRTHGIPYEQLISVLPEEHRGRPLGFHASRSGACYRQVVVEVVNRGFLGVYEDAERDRVLTLGNLLHDWVSDAMAAETWRRGGTLLNIRPMCLKAFDNCSCRVLGTPDELLLDLDTLDLHIVDYKSCKTRAFDLRQASESAQQGHRLQVATYMAGMQHTLASSGLGRTLAALRHLVSRAGSDLSMDGAIPDARFRARGYVCYLHKENLEAFTVPVGGQEVIPEAASYWTTVYRLYGDAIRGVAPKPLPLENWQCGYCPLFPNPHLKSTPARKKHAVRQCSSTPSHELLGRSSMLADVSLSQEVAPCPS